MSIKEDKSNCVFCQIVAARSFSSLVYQDDRIMVFPDLHPVNPGHLLIIPKIHSVYLADVEEETAADIMKMAIRLGKAIRESHFQCEGINVFVADGEAAGQEVFHFHMHVYPRFLGDGFGFKYDKSRHFIQMEQDKLNEVAKEIKSHMDF